MTKVKAYSYLRISSDRQKQGGGIKRQMEASAKWAEDNGYALAETIADEGISAFTGTHAKKGGFARFLAAVDSGAVERGSILIVESLDRLSREKVMDAFDQFRDIVKRGINIVTLVDGQVYSEDSMNQNIGQLFLSLGVMLRSHEESVTKSKRGKAAWQQKRAAAADSSKILTKNAPAWLELTDDRTAFHIKEPHGESIKKIFELSIGGMGAYSITRYLNKNLDTYPAMGAAKSWNDSYVIKILTSPAVLGHFQPNEKIDGKKVPIGELIADYYPAVVDEDRYYLAQAGLKSRKTGAAGRKGEYFANLFSGVAFCGKCGGGMLHRNKGKPPRGYRFLRCANSLKGNGCNCPAWRYSEFEEAFLKWVAEVSFAEVFEGSNSANRVTELKQRKESATAKLEDKQAAYNALIGRFANPELSDSLLANLIKFSEELEDDIFELKEEVATLDADIRNISSENVDKDQREFLEKYKELIEANDNDKMREARFLMHGIIRKNIDRIEVFNGEKCEPWEAMELLPEQVGQMLFDMGHKTVDAFEQYFSKPTGQRLFDKVTRSFVIHFKNGVARRVESDYSALDTSITDLNLIKSFQK
ncbi:recombinase family protein [Rhodobacteraceae bacterium R_SAG6]|nr:recombinase family protein [Rhodobacteraceae bacterium R_SAG6]